MTLKEWLEKTNNKQVTIAKKIGISTAQFNKFVNGSQIPSLLLADQIQKTTKGMVTLDDWLREVRNAKRNN